MTAIERLSGQPEILLPPECREMIRAGALVAVSHSGGKDSQAWRSFCRSSFATINCSSFTRRSARWSGRARLSTSSTRFLRAHR